METATFEDLLRLKLRKEEQSSEAVEFPIASIGKNLRFHAPTSVQQLDFIDAARKSGDISGCYPAYKQLVYDCCDMLHTAELQNQCDCKEPTDIVDKLFTPLELIELGDRLTDRFFRLGDAVKNSYGTTEK